MLILSIGDIVSISSLVFNQTPPSRDFLAFPPVVSIARLVNLLLLVAHLAYVMSSWEIYFLQIGHSDLLMSHCLMHSEWK
jgi:hypothetical protein